MKRFILLAASALLLSVSTGCLHHNVAPTDPGCGCGGGGLLGGVTGGRLAHAIHESQGWRHQRPQLGPQGPPTGTTAYPYYTLHGPRDFLVDNPPSLGN
jgi:hypothetical protein